MTFEDLIRYFVRVFEQLAERHARLKNAPQWQVKIHSQRRSRWKALGS